MKKILAILFFVLSFVSVAPAFAQGGAGEGNIILPSSECTTLSKSMQFKYNNTDAVTNGEVSILQRFLRANGYVNYNKEKLGVFDKETRAGVALFQSDYGMTADGVVGSLTRRQIRVLSCEKDFSDSSAKIKVISQNSGEVYKAGQKIKVMWSTDDLPNTRDLRVGIYSLGKGANMVVSAFVMDGSKERELTIPENASGSYKVMIHEVLKDSVFGVSEVFNIGQPLSPSIDRISFPASLYVNQGGALAVYTTNPNGGALNFSINWGDTSVTNLKDVEQGGDLTFSHTYTKSGTYVINIKITDDYGKSAERVTQVVVKDKEVLQPVIYGISGPSSVKINQENSWLVLASAPQTETLTSFSVDWGEPVYCIPEKPCDVRQLPEQNSPLFYHTYKEAGVYNVIFYVKSSGGGITSKSMTVTVSQVVNPINVNTSSVL